MNDGSTIIQGISPRLTHQTGGMCCCLWTLIRLPMERGGMP
jgi:hypothetical protein